MKTIRVELTFSSGKFIAWENVIDFRISNDNKYIILKIDNPDCTRNSVNVLVDKLDFYEVFDKN